MRKPAVPVAVIAAAAIVVGYLFLELRTERVAAAQLRDRVARLEGAAHPAGSAVPAPRPADQASPSAGAPVHESPPATPTPDANRLQTIERPLFSPAIRKELGLTEEEGKEFVRLLMSDASQADFVALIGADKYEQYQDSQRAAARRQRVNQFRTSLADTGHPLTESQAAQLDLLLDADQRRRTADDKERVRPADPRALLEYDEARLKSAQTGTERVVADARGFLTVEQLAVLQSQLGSTVDQQLDSLRTRRAQLDAGGR